MVSVIQSSRYIDLPIISYITMTTLIQGERQISKDTYN